MSHLSFKIARLLALLCLLLVACQTNDLSGTVVHNSGDPLGTPGGRTGSIRGEVVTASGESVAEVPLYLEMLSPPFTTDQIGRVTLPDGTFDIIVPPGRYKVTAKTLSGSSASDAVEVAAGQTMRITLRLGD